jgi:NAD(P)-dependent dehydrogenase (short-subunit alcohol dehydrogenase family)
VVLAGASSALGNRVAQSLSQQGWGLKLLGRDIAKLNALKETLPGPASVHTIDVEKRLEVVAGTVAEIVEQDEFVTGLVSLLGYLKPAPMELLSLGDWSKSLQVNFLSNVELLRGFSSSRVTADNVRHAILVSSVASVRGDFGLAPYAASKAALESLVRSSGRELATHRITVNAISFGLASQGMGLAIKRRVGSSAFDSLANRYPLGIGGGAELQSAIDFLLNQKPAWTTGTVLTVDGGYSLT